jgi:hypothetical protein
MSEGKTMDMEFQRYIALLEAVTPIINEHFEMQKEYIKCKIGCCNCCQKGYYPVTRAEAKLLKVGFEALDPSLKEEITKRAEKLNNERDAFVKEGNPVLKFKYVWPFLVDDKCSIYQYRGVICRTQGLLLQSINDSAVVNMPACVNIGLNYANMKDENLQTPPVALDFSYESLVKMCGADPDTLEDDLKNPNSNEIRMIFEWILVNP